MTTTNTRPLPPLDRTRLALSEFDAIDARFRVSMVARMAPAESLALLDALESAGEAVGVAFGLDTADRNSLDTCRNCVRPGPAIPPPGHALSFVRRMVLSQEAKPAIRPLESVLVHWAENEMREEFVLLPDAFRAFLAAAKAGNDTRGYIKVKATLRFEGGEEYRGLRFDVTAGFNLDGPEGLDARTLEGQERIFA